MRIHHSFQILHSARQIAKRILVFCLVAAAMLGNPTVLVAAISMDPWEPRLYTPTYLQKIDGVYFLIDCWHHRILYASEIYPDINRWSVLADDVGGPHSVATDGELYVFDDTGNDSLRSYIKQKDGTFKHFQTIPDLGKRTHRVLYDRETSAFYVVSSDSQHISKLTRNGRLLNVEYIKPLSFLNGQYTRSITIWNQHMYFVSGDNFIAKTRYQDDTYEVVDRYPVPTEMKNMNDLFKSEDGYWYLTATPKQILRVQSLDDLKISKYESVYEKLGLQGTPYYFSYIDGRYYLTQIMERSGIISFVHDDRGEISDVQVHFDFERPSLPDRKRYWQYLV